MTNFEWYIATLCKLARMPGNPPPPFPTPPYPSGAHAVLSRSHTLSCRERHGDARDSDGAAAACDTTQRRRVQRAPPAAAAHGRDHPRARCAAVRRQDDGRAPPRRRHVLPELPRPHRRRSHVRAPTPTPNDVLSSARQSAAFWCQCAEF
eukprot:3725103-Rhodomonas_salina.1